MCKTSNKATRLAIQAQERQAAEARVQAEQALAEQRRIAEDNQRLQQQQLQFQKEQAEYVKSTNAKMEELANRPAPPPPLPTAVVSTSMAEAGGTEDKVASRKRGRAALRIDLNAPQTAGNTGLNVPRG